MTAGHQLLHGTVPAFQDLDIELAHAVTTKWAKWGLDELKLWLWLWLGHGHLWSRHTEALAKCGLDKLRQWLELEWLEPKWLRKL